MAELRAPVPGRGTRHDPHNRFEPLAIELDPQHAGEDGAPETRLYRDPSRSLISSNDSPDIGFDLSINPYRGCEHGCVYCLAPDSRVLLADLGWRSIGSLRVGDRLIGFDELPEPGRTRKLRPATVEAIWWSRKRTLRLVTDHADVLTTPEHLWLQHRDFRWSRTDRLGVGCRLRRVPQQSRPRVTDDYRVGYLAGMTLGDGAFRYEPGWRSDKLGFPQSWWRVALKDIEPLERLVSFMARLGMPVAIRPFDPGPRSSTKMWKVETRRLGHLERIYKLLHADLESACYERGFVAGFFDAEGSHGRSLRFFQKDEALLRRTQTYLQRAGFRSKLETRPGVSSARLVGSSLERLRFLTFFDPCIARKKEALLGHQFDSKPEKVLAVEPGPEMDLVDITTSTGTFFAEGLATHNCYARPSHEYLGWSAGLDFETRVLVKTEAPALLRRELSARSYRPKVIALSGVTDCYQPAERKLRLTRGCLEVLAELGHPATIITKSRLVTRDVDVLRRLAELDAVSVTLSVTTLDRDLARKLEPRAAQPAARLAAIRELARAGIPVGVLVGPVIPALNDHEIPRIYEAARDAGARWAGHVMLRLPGATQELFERWLEDHVPERRRHVLSRIRQLRGGRLNDPRFGARMRGSGPFARQTAELARVARLRCDLADSGPELSTAHFRKPSDPSGRQLELF